jgi:hypothetical protein
VRERDRPTDDQRRTVRAMSGYGIPQEDIATFFDIDAETLRKHFRHEIDKGSIEATSKVAQSLFRMATEGKNVAAAIFWMKARAGWREKHPELLDDERNAEAMTDEELEIIARGGKPAPRQLVIRRIIIDPKDQRSPVIDGRTEPQRNGGSS